MNRLHNVIAVVFGVCISSWSVAGPLEDAELAFSKADYATALRLLRGLAEKGNAAAQSDLGTMYWRGLGVPQDYGEGSRWIRQAAGQGYAPAQYNLAISYRDGLGNPKDDIEALHWYQRAADQGFAPAQHSLASRYFAGRTVTKDDAEAVRWYRKAADQGWASSMAALGTLYAQGRGVQRDPVAAYKWMILADNGLPAQQRDELRSARSQLEKTMTRTEIETALRQARAWTSMGSNSGPGYVRGIGMQNRGLAMTEGQSIDLPSYTVAVPPGTGWKAEILPDKSGVSFVRTDPSGAEQVIVGITRQDIDSRGGGDNEDEIVTRIQRQEEAEYRDRGSARLYSIANVASSTTYIADKKLHRITLTITDESTGVTVQSVASGYTYFSTDWRDTRKFYMFVIEQRPVKKTSEAAADAIVAAILNSLREASRPAADQSRWQQLTNSSCLVWNPAPCPKETITWSGSCVNGKAEGTGLEVDRCMVNGAWEEERYEGEMKNGKQQGHGTLHYPDGSRFTGSFENNRRVVGALLYPGGARYEGHFANDAFDGKGTFTYADGSYYAGEFRRGFPNGYGSLHASNGDNITGQWINGCFRQGNRIAAVGVSKEVCESR